MRAISWVGLRRISRTEASGAVSAPGMSAAVTVSNVRSEMIAMLSLSPGSPVDVFASILSVVAPRYFCPTNSGFNENLTELATEPTEPTERTPEFGTETKEVL